MSENTAPERIDLAGLIEQLESAHEYQLHLEAENRRLTADLEEVRADYGDLVENRDAFARRVQDLERECQGLNRDQTELAARVDELKAQLANQDTVPRVTTFDELKVGLAVATFADDGFPVAGEVTVLGGNGFTLRMHGDKIQTFTADRDTYLLEIAPPKSRNRSRWATR